MSRPSAESLSPNLIPIRFYLCLTMIFSENRFPLFGIMVQMSGILTIKGKGKLSARIHACGRIAARSLGQPCSLAEGAAMPARFEVEMKMQGMVGVGARSEHGLERSAGGLAHVVEEFAFLLGRRRPDFDLLAIR